MKTIVPALVAVLAQMGAQKYGASALGKLPVSLNISSAAVGVVAGVLAAKYLG